MATKGCPEAGASGSGAAAGGGGAMADDNEGGGGGGGGGQTSPSKAQRQHLAAGSVALAAGSVARLAKSPLVQLASLLLADRQVDLMLSDCKLIATLISAARVAPTRRSAGRSDAL